MPACGGAGGQPITPLDDPNGNLSSLQTGWGAFSFGFDPRDQATSVADPGAAGIRGGTTSLAYDVRMLLARQDNPNGAITTLAYDANRRTAQVWHAGAGTGLYDGTIFGSPTFGSVKVDRGLAVFSNFGRAGLPDSVARMRRSDGTLPGARAAAYDTAPGGVNVWTGLRTMRPRES